MPGGNKFRQWYAMRKAMQERGTWHGNRPTHSVPQLEEGEPPPRRPRTGTLQLRADEDTSPSQGDPDSPIKGIPSSSDSSSTPESLPSLEASPTPSGNGPQWLFSTCLGQA